MDTNIARDVYIERQDPEVAARETPQETLQRLLSYRQQQGAQAQQSYVDANFERPAVQTQIPQQQTEVWQTGNRPRISQPNLPEQWLSKLRMLTR